MAEAYREARKTGASRIAALRFQIAVYLMRGSCVVYVNLGAPVSQLSQLLGVLDQAQEAVSQELSRRSMVSESLSEWLPLGPSGPSMN